MGNLAKHQMGATMNGTKVCFTVVLVSTLCFAGIAKANLLSNGDFSTGTLAGWETSGNVIATDYASMPAGYRNTWDLSAWNARMDGSFALFESTPSHLYAKATQVPGSSPPTSLSLDYAVAWSNPTIPDAGGNPNASGYFYVQTFGVTADGQVHPLTYNEVAWFATDPGPDKDVITGTLYTQNFIQYPDLDFKDILMDINAYNPNQSLNQIIGIDNVNLSVPTPEPSTIILFSIGMAGLAGFGRRLKRS